MEEGQPKISERCLGWFHQAGTRILRSLPPESAHQFGSRLMNMRWFRSLPKPSLQLDADLGISVPGLGRLLHPVGIAGGFDKDGDALGGLSDLGFAFLEVGTVTPRPQGGNTGPRLFRLSGQRALVNRMGFNNKGLAYAYDRIKAFKSRSGCLVGANIGKNADTPLEDAAADYVASARAMHSISDFLVINVSSPNTPGLRSLADDHFFRQVAQEFRAIDGELIRKTWIKLDPDLSRKDMQDLVYRIGEEGFAGLVLTNTHKVQAPYPGGMSGHPISVMSTRSLEWAWQVHKGALAMVGCGGILSGRDIFEKVIRGACCAQIYTAFVYRGPWVVFSLLSELDIELREAGFSKLSEAVGSYYD